MCQLRDVQRAESLALLEIIKDLTRPTEERVDGFTKLLAMPYGFWRHDDATNDESLLGYAMRVARTTLSLNGLPPDVDAEDIAQETVLALFNKAYQINENPRAWVKTVAKNKALKYARGLRGVRLVQVKESITATDDHAGDNEPDAARTLEQQEVRDAIDQMPDKTRQIMALHLEHLTHEEIANRLGMTQMAVRQRISRARQALKKHLPAMAARSAA